MKNAIGSLPDVNRVEVISKNGREYVNLDCKNVHIDIQDEGRTVKIFLNLDDDIARSLQ